MQKNPLCVLISEETTTMLYLFNIHALTWLNTIRAIARHIVNLIDAIYIGKKLIYDIFNSHFASKCLQNNQHAHK